jgi:hypothetical protein
MRLCTQLPMALLFGLWVSAASQAAESVVLPALGDACKSLPADQESGLWRCPGPIGYGFIYFDHVTRGNLAFGPRGRELALTDDLSWHPADEGIGSHIEWRTLNGKPFAAILARWRRIDTRQDEPTVVEFMVAKVSDKGGCLIGSLEALRPNALADARSLADGLGPGFRCGVDQPSIAADEDLFTVKKLDGRFAVAETLDHNRSLVVMTRSREGAVEIRYSEPRSALQIEPGTLLFQGQERAGQIQGEAFVFKAGCAPAGYPVTGRRTDGVLVLEGTAPHRGRGCEIVGGARNSRYSNLVFHYDPMLNSPDVESVMSGPLVVTRAQCSQCMPASITSLEGVGTERATVEARFNPQDIVRYCQNESTHEPSAAELSDCIRQYSGEVGKMLRAEANCSDRTIKPTSSGSYKFFAMGEDYGGRAPTWTNLANGKIECGSRACNGANVTSDFTLLCPKAIPGWSGRH